MRAAEDIPTASRCACDIPAHNYTFSFEPNHKWSTTYASAAEVKQYLVEFSEIHHLRKYIRFENQVLSAQWSEPTSQWKLQVRPRQEDSCNTIEETYDILIHATGYLNNWAWPDIGGRQDYSGNLIHSAQWDSGVSLDGKVVGLIGNGSSAVQILQSIQPKAKHVFNFIRSPNWIVPSLGEDNHPYSEEDIDGFKTDSDSLLALQVQADYILQLVDRYQTENSRSFRPKPAAVGDFMAYVRNFMNGTVWMQGCRSGYKSHTVFDRNPTLWPGSTLHYREALRELRADDWELEYSGNQFDWLGNGISQAEFDPTRDLGYYVQSKDDGPYASRRKRREVLTRSGTQPSRPLHQIYRPTVVNL
ncbi:MAG: hypothetical protein Q9203_001588 [Teloschistes exilis]